MHKHYATNTYKTRNKSNASTEAVQYRQDVFPIAHYHKGKTSLAIHVVQKITIIREQKIGKIRGFKFDTQ